MGDARRGYSLMKLLGVQGKKVDVIPTTKGMDLTELYSKRGDCMGEYMGAILYDKKWKKYVLVDLHKDMQMSLDCLKEAFELTEKYWKEHSETRRIDNMVTYNKDDKEGMKKRTLNQFMKEIKDVFQKYNKDIPLNMLVNSADLYVDTLKKELSDNSSKKEEVIEQHQL